MGHCSSSSSSTDGSPAKDASPQLLMSHAVPHWAPSDRFRVQWCLHLMTIRHHSEVAADGCTEPAHVLLGTDNGGLLAVAPKDATAFHPGLQLLVPSVGADEIDDGNNQLVALAVNPCSPPSPTQHQTMLPRDAHTCKRTAGNTTAGEDNQYPIRHLPLPPLLSSEAVR